MAPPFPNEITQRDLAFLLGVTDRTIRYLGEKQVLVGSRTVAATVLYPLPESVQRFISYRERCAVERSKSQTKPHHTHEHTIYSAR
jgi:hypothetical protein